MKICLAFVLSLSSVAFAVDKDLMLSDGMTFNQLHQSLQSQFMGKDLEITDYSRNWSDYNPMKFFIGKVEGRQTTFRNLEIRFTDRWGRQQILKCESQTWSDSNNLLINGCRGSDRPIYEHLYLHRHGYNLEAILIHDILNRSENSQQQASGTRSQN